MGAWDATETGPLKWALQGSGRRYANYVPYRWGEVWPVSRTFSGTAVRAYSCSARADHTRDDITDIVFDVHTHTHTHL